jgi:hypothetical protein
MKLSTALEKATTVSFVKVAGCSLTVMNEANELVTMEIADGQLPKETVVGSKLSFDATGVLTGSEHPNFKPAAKTGRTGCLEARVQG